MDLDDVKEIVARATDNNYEEVDIVCLQWLEDAARWQALPAFFEEYQIDALKLYRDIDAYLDAARKQGANHD